MNDSIFDKKQTRRGFIKAGSAAAMGIIATHLLRPAFGTNNAKVSKLSVKGTVFKDTNQNGIQDSGEPGIPNVLVSDGQSVTRTSVNGQYVLETTAFPMNQYSRKFIFITTPSGYQLDSRDYYRELSVPYKGGNQVNFGLRESSTEQTKYNFAFMTDMHIGEGMDKNGDLFQETINDIKAVNKNMRLDFVASGGDICYRAMELYKTKIHQIESDNITVFNTPGNHDMDENSDYTGPRKGIFNDYFGPTYFSFDHGNVHFIMLDTTAWIPGIGPHNVIGCVDNAQKKWLIEDLNYIGEDKPIVVMCHIPVKCTTWQRRSDGAAWKVCWEVINNTEILDILKKYNVGFIFQGHMHENEHIFEHNIDISSVGAVSGNWWQRDGSPCCPDGSPPGYLIVSVNGDEILPIYKGTGRDKEYQMEILEPDNSSTAEGYINIMVNFFYGSEKDQLFYRINEGAWSKLFKTEVPVKDTRIPEKRYSLNTNHIWLASEQKPAGEYVITVKAIDRHGRMWFQSSRFGD